MASVKGNSKKWTNEEITALIDAYKEESCLYAVNSSQYHNKHLRNEALKRVGNAVRILKPYVTDKDCASKFHALRSQYNIENAKIKTSKKSGTGTDNIYKPSLWYYEYLTFLDTFFTPRKSRNSLVTDENNKTEENSVFSQTQDHFFSQDSIHVVADGISEDGHLNVFIEERLNNESDRHTTSSESSTIEISRQCTAEASTSMQPPICSPQNVSRGSIRSSSSASPTMSSSSGKRRRKANDDAYAEAVQSLADSLRQPIVMTKNDSPADTLDGFLMFIGSMLRSFQDENLQLDVMNTCIQTCINARTVDLQRSQNS